MEYHPTRFGPILSIYEARKQEGFYNVPSLGLRGLEVLGGLPKHYLDNAFTAFFHGGAESEIVSFFKNQLRFATFAQKGGVPVWINISPWALFEHEIVIDALYRELLIRQKRPFRRDHFERRYHRVGFELLEIGTLTSKSCRFLQDLSRAYPLALDDVGGPGGNFATSDQLRTFVRDTKLTVKKLKIDQSLVVGKDSETACADVRALLEEIKAWWSGELPEITVQGVPVNPHGPSLDPHDLMTAHARALFAEYQSKAQAWRLTLYELQAIGFGVTVQLPPITAEDLIGVST